MKAWVALNAAPGIGPRRFHQILRVFGSPELALGSTAQRLSQACPGLGLPGAGLALKAALSFDADGEIGRAADLGLSLIKLGDEGYPQPLMDLPDSPPLLYLRGRLPALESRRLAVVGTRKPSDYGLLHCRAVLGGLAKSGFSVISGLARGIDTAAHEAALDFGLPTLGVLGSGLSNFYPRENAALAARMVERGGGVLSQFHLDAAPEKHRFPMRNGLIAALSSGVFVVEGAEDSGSLITAAWALEQGREIFALPGRVDWEQSRGPHRLIQQGAKLVIEARDILAEFPEHAALARPQPKAPPRPGGQQALPGMPMAREALTGQEALIAARLRQLGRCRPEELAERLGLSPEAMLAALTMLEIKGALRKLPGAWIEAL